MIGDLWQIPGGHEGLELSGSTRDQLRIGLIREGWQWLAPPIIVARVLCERLPMRYYCGQVAPDVSEH